MTLNPIYQQIFKIWRARRFEVFKRTIQPDRTMNLLDVGGYPGSWTCYPPVVGSITCLNVHPVAWDPSSAPDHRITTILGDGCHLDFEDKSFDIVFSNSVIEHVGSRRKQEAFASECRRVGKAIWIQTPAFECPIEPHYLAPFVHWLPASAQRRILRHFTPWGLIQKPTSADVDEMVATTRLLTRREFTSMCRDCSIYAEKLLGFLPKSYTACRREVETPLSSAKSPMTTPESGMLPNLK